jgi:hypothetical protein
MLFILSCADGSHHGVNFSVVHEKLAHTFEFGTAVFYGTFFSLDDFRKPIETAMLEWATNIHRHGLWRRERSHRFQNQ